MKILFLTTHLNTGGITRYLLTLSRGLVKSGHEVFIASSSGDAAKDFETQGAHLLTLDIRTKSMVDSRVYAALAPLQKYVLENNIDVIHAQTRVTQVMGWFLKRKTHRPFIATCHGFFRPRWLRKLFPCWGDYTIAISEQVREHLKNDFHIPETRISLIHNGVDAREFSPVSSQEKSRRRKELGLEESQQIIGIVARLSDVKGQDILIRAFKKVHEQKPHARLLIVGQGKLEFELKALTKELELEAHVKFYQDLNKTAYFLSVFDVFANPSRQEGLGISVMEAQACGVPVVASRVGGIPSLIEEGKSGYLVEPQNPDELANKLFYVLDHQDEVARIVEFARKNVQARYSSDQMVKQTIDVYQSAVKE